VTRVEIDLNVRVRGNWTFSGLEDADGPVEVGDIVEVYEVESGLVGPGRVEEVDEASHLIYLSVDWDALHEPELASARWFGGVLSTSQRQGVSTVGHYGTRCPSRVDAVAAVACVA
jgi:hypothetical protein